jgi:hypothetical protein
LCRYLGVPTVCVNFLASLHWYLKLVDCISNVKFDDGDNFTEKRRDSSPICERNNDKHLTVGLSQVAREATDISICLVIHSKVLIKNSTNIASIFLAANLRKVRTEIVRQGERRVGRCGHTSTKENLALALTEGVDTSLNLRTEVTHEALNGPCSGITERADRAAFDLLTIEKESKTRV